MSATQATSETAIETQSARAVDMKLEVVVIPVSDVDRAKAFYGSLGWRLDADFAAGDDFRVIQFTPPGSGCSVIFGKNVTAAAPGSAQGLYLIVSDIGAARDALLGRGVEISDVFHGAGGVYAGKDEPYLFGRVRDRVQEEVVGFWLASATHPFCMLVHLVHVVRDRAPIVEELAQDIEAAFSAHHVCAARRPRSAAIERNPMKDLAGKTAFVTGAASGIGPGIATALAQGGVKMMLCDIEEAALAKAVETLKKTNADVDGVKADVSLKSELEAAAKATLDRYGKVHILVNNAGVGGPDRSSRTGRLRRTHGRSDRPPPRARPHPPRRDRADQGGLRADPDAHVQAVVGLCPARAESHCRLPIAQHRSRRRVRGGNPPRGCSPSGEAAAAMLEPPGKAENPTERKKRFRRVESFTGRSTCR